MTSRTVLRTLVICLLVSACGEQKNLHEMHDATIKMNTTTEQMNQKTEGLAKSSESLDKKTGKLLESTEKLTDSTEQLVDTSKGIAGNSAKLKDTTDELYDALRQGNALQLRRDAYDAILKAATMPKKISEAAKYMMSFEVQLWNQYGQDGTQEKRDILAQQAAQEFYLEIEELADRDGSIDPTAQPDFDQIHSKENHRASFNALAAAMNQMNRKQAAALDRQKSLPPISMLSMTEEALLSREKVANGEDLGTKTGYIREVLTHEAKAIQLLQARYNLFPLVFIDEVTHLGDKNIFGKAKMALFGWDLDLNQVSTARMEFLNNEVLAQAIEARDFLKKIGVQPQMNSTVARLLKKMSIKGGGQQGAKAASEQTRMTGLLLDLRKNL